MRAVVVTIAVFALGAAGCGSTPGSQATGSMQISVVQAPLPPDASGSSVELSQLACASPGNCAATGSLVLPGQLQGLLFVERGGTWSVSEPAMPKGLGVGAKSSVTVSSVACPAVGRCVAVGSAASAETGEPLAFTQTGSTWRESVVPLPAGARSGAYSELRLVSCPTPGNCTAAGFYTDAQAHQQGLLVSETNGKWGKPTTAGLPPNADFNTGGGQTPFIDALSCSSPGNCGAVGLYGDHYGSPQGWLLAETDGVWARGVEAKLPPNASLGEGSFLYPVLGLGSVSCPTDGNCTAVGGYGGAKSNQLGMTLTERGGRWLPAQEVPLPSNAGPDPQQGDVSGSPLGPLACYSPANCIATGTYEDTSGESRMLLLAEHSGQWVASEPVLPPDASGPSNAGLDAVACASAGSCLAGGTYSTKPKSLRLLFVSERSGRWGAGQGASLPSSRGGYITSSSCPSAKACVAITAGGAIVTIRR